MKNLTEMLQSEAFMNYQGDKLGNDLFINDPERAERIHDAASEGCDGSTHAEHLEDMRDYLGTLSVFDPEFDPPEDIDDFDITQEVYDKISQEISACENWHDKNGSLYQSCG